MCITKIQIKKKTPSLYTVKNIIAESSPGNDSTEIESTLGSILYTLATALQCGEVDLTST